MWIITHDFTETPGAAGITSRCFEEGERAKLTERFRLVDGDGEVYFEGVSDNSSSEAAFDPLDDFGEGHAGCGAIEYWVNQQWRPL